MFSQPAWRYGVFGILINVLCLASCGAGGDKVAGLNAVDYFSNDNSRQLAIAAATGNLEEMANLIDAGVDVNYIGKDDMTPLMWSYAAKNIDGMTYLLEKGANPNFVAKNGASVTSIAAGGESLELLKIALEHGGDPNAKNINGDPAIFIAMGQRRWGNMYMLIEHGADINGFDRFGNTPVMAAAVLNQFEQVAHLLELGADYTIKSPTGGYLAYYVQASNVNPKFEGYAWREKVIEMLEKRGVNFPVPPPEKKTLEYNENNELVIRMAK